MLQIPVHRTRAPAPPDVRVTAHRAVPGDHNAVVVSQGTLAKIAQASRRGIQNALAVLEQERWIELRQIGDRGTVNAYILNDRAVWHGHRDGLRYSLFSAMILVDAAEQPDQEDLGNQPALRRLPRLYPNERQLPSGDGLPPPSQPFFDGMEPDLPASYMDKSEDE